MHVVRMYRKLVLLALDFRHCTFVLSGGEETDVGELSNGDFDLFNSLVGVILNVDIHGNGFTMVVQLEMRIKCW